VHERTLLDHAMRDGRGALEAPTSELMSEPLPIVQSVRRLDDVYHDLQSSPAVLVADGNSPIGVLTRADVLEWLAHA
jgi:cystathionine beta-synthase